MKILFYYFSGTGNTAYVSEKLKGELEKRGAEVFLSDIEKLSAEKTIKADPEKFDLLGFGYPIHAFRAPAIFDDFVKELKVTGKKYFIVKNSREYMSLNDASSAAIVKNMKKKGCSFLREEHLLMPYNIHFKHPDSLVKQMLVALDEKIPTIADNIIRGKEKPFRRGITASLSATFIGGAERWGAHLIGNSLRAGESCVSCGKCALNCPVLNVKMKRTKDGKILPDFKNGKCILCMRCISGCPKKCIEFTRFIKGWEVVGGYDFEQIKKDDSIPPEFIGKDYKGSMAKSYKKYFFGQNRQKILNKIKKSKKKRY